MQHRLSLFAMLLALSFVAHTPFAVADVPACKFHGQILAVNNGQVAQWKAQAQDQFHARGHIVGQITRIYPIQTGHLHFQVTMTNIGSTIEVIFNLEPGKARPPIQVGAMVESCGDYISTPHGGREPSPDDAILHWVHRSPDPSRHDDGYLAVNGVTYGMDFENDRNNF